MASPLDALAEALHDSACGCRDLGDWESYRSEARACLRAIGEGKVLAQGEIARLLYKFAPRDKANPAVCVSQAEAILRAFREAGE